MRVLRRLFREYPLQTLLLVAALLVAGVANSVSLSAGLPALSVLMEGDDSEPSGFEQFVLEVLASAGIEPTLLPLLCIILVGVTIRAIMTIIANTGIGYVGADVATNLRMDLLRAILRSRWSYFSGQSPGKLANSMSTEALRASLTYQQAVRVAFLSVESLIYGLFALLVSWEATLMAVISSAIILLASRRLVTMARGSGVRQTFWYRQLLGTLTDTLQSVKTFKAMGRESLADEVMSNETEELRGALRQEALATASLESAQEPMYAIVAVLFIYVAVEVFGVGIATVTFLCVALFNLLKQVGKVQKQYQRMLTYESAYSAIRDAVREAEQAEEPEAGSLPARFEEEIRLEQVGFSYGEHPVLSDLDLVIPAGQVVCLVGMSGSGKTTITDLVMGLVRPERGRVMVDGVDLDRIDRQSWRRSIGYVPQENLLLHASVLRNVTLGDPDVSEADVIEALKAAEAWSFVEAMPEGLHTVVGERGTRISSGQRQRIMIARALLGRPRLLILDEATSALDPDSDRAIAETMLHLAGDLTILVVAHHSVFTEMADKVCRLERGRLVDEAPGSARRALAAD